MSWSLKLTNGDLAVTGASLDTVTVEQKLAQDLRCWILERMGTDSLHPGFGSLIDGGVKPDGTVVEGIIGEIDTDVALLGVEADLLRIVTEYQAQQLARAKSDRFVYNKTTLTSREVLLGIDAVDSVMEGDVLTVTLTVQTASSQFINFTFAIPTSG